MLCQIAICRSCGKKPLKSFVYEKGPGKPSNTVNRSRMREVKGSLTWAVSC